MICYTPLSLVLWRNRVLRGCPVSPQGLPSHGSLRWPHHCSWSDEVWSGMSGWDIAAMVISRSQGFSTRVCSSRSKKQEATDWGLRRERETTYKNGKQYFDRAQNNVSRDTAARGPVATNKAWNVTQQQQASTSLSTTSLVYHILQRCMWNHIRQLFFLRLLVCGWSRDKAQTPGSRRLGSNWWANHKTMSRVWVYIYVLLNLVIFMTY